VFVLCLGWDWGREDVDEDYFVVGVQEVLREQLAYKSAGACDEDLHGGGWVGVLVLLLDMS